MKALRFIGSSLDDLRNFPPGARRDAGFELDAVQRGLMPTHFKPMLNVGAGAYEIRLHILGEWRVIYVAKFDDAVSFCTPSRRRRTRLARKTSNLPLDVIDRLETEL